MGDEQLYKPIYISILRKLTNILPHFPVLEKRKVKCMSNIPFGQERRQEKAEGGRRRQGATGPVPMACHWYICIKMQEKIYAVATIDGKPGRMI